ncbi:MAG: hypothetical protein A2289_25045 [Deltaproteobacteria bacterium RIFOXYA12_FULL_58_15]|nr:MAG: hypothetical protein A2289_25045 [Deltaproteobacteria bacterium RIFOXYA12_FULL_58_15]OGR11008.1 MAG: hypothetical protein A2341_11515 [Deltaproteobacteria bacterium RIFOXYB12_FULL_58_9]
MPFTEGAARGILNPGMATILIVDDESMICRVLSETLKGEGRTIVTANSAEEGLRKLESIPSLDLAFVDKNLPDRNGLELVRKLKQRYPDAEYIMITAYASIDAAVEAVRLGLFDFITKPFDIADVEQVANKALEKVETVRNNAKQRKINEEHQQLLLASVDDGIWDWDLTAGTISFSPRAHAFLGITDDVIGDVPSNWQNLVIAEDAATFASQLQMIHDGTSTLFDCEVRMRHANGGQRWVWIRGSALIDSDATARRIVGFHRDVTDRRTVEAHLAHTADHDQLTGLLNRPAFVERIEQALLSTKRDPSTSFAVLAIDLNGFGRINDTLGHNAGDEVLIRWVERISRQVRPHDAFARIGADQFTILLNGIRTPNDAEELAERINRGLLNPFEVRDRQVTISVSVGIALGQDYENAEDILRDAGTALVQAKVEGKGTHVTFVDAMHNRAVELLTLDQGLRTAVAKHEFIAVYQPIISIETGRIVAFEALARWQHPTRGLLAPAQFLNRAAEVGFLAEISWQITTIACLQQRRWLDALGSNVGLTINLNVAPPLLLRRSFVSELTRLLDDLSLPPDSVKIEVTEIVAIDNTQASAEIIQQLRRLGIAVCLDDFGTGYASLSWLHNFPVDEIKIDRSFVTDMTTDRRSHVLVGAAVNLAHSLGLPVVAEGVETQEQLAELRTMSCEYAQGFLFSRPLAVDKAESILLAGSMAAG